MDKAPANTQIPASSKAGVKVKKVTIYKDDSENIGVLIYYDAEGYSTGILVTLFGGYEEAIAQTDDENELKELIVSATQGHNIDYIGIVEVHIASGIVTVTHKLVEIDLVSKEITIKASVLDEAPTKVEGFYYPYPLVERLSDVIMNKMTFAEYVEYIKNYVISEIISTEFDRVLHYLK